MTGPQASLVFAHGVSAIATPIGRGCASASRLPELRYDTELRQLEHDRPRIPSQRKKESRCKASYIHVVAFPGVCCSCQGFQVSFTLQVKQVWFNAPASSVVGPLERIWVWGFQSPMHGLRNPPDFTPTSLFSKRVQSECYHGIGAKSPYLVWVLGT